MSEIIIILTIYDIVGLAVLVYFVRRIWKGKWS